MMKDTNIKCPIECMLYASLVINSRFSNDASLYDYIGREISDILDYSETMKKISCGVINHILKNWNWSNQIKCLISGIGLYGKDVELIRNVLDLVKNRDDRVYVLT